jgi:ribosome-associated protein
MTGTAEPQEQPEYIELQQALKLARVVDTGGQAKYMIQNGEVMVNGVVETRRRRKLYPGDSFEVGGEVYHIGD